MKFWYFVFLVLNVVITKGNSDIKDELYQASFIGDVSRVEFLLNLDPDVLTSRPPVLVNRKIEPYGRTSVMVCGLDPQKEATSLDSDCTKIVKMIHNKGGNLNFTDNSGWDALSLAAFRGLTKLTRFILKTKEVAVNRADNDGRTPLMKAAANGYNSTYHVLIQFGGDLRQQDPQGRTSLHYVTLFAIKDHEMGLPFLEKALSLHTNYSILQFVDQDKRNLLMYAAIANDVQVVEVILRHLADHPNEVINIDQLDRFQMTAISMTSSDYVKELLSSWEINSVMQQHEKWLQHQKKQLLQEDDRTLHISDEETKYDTHHVLINPQ